MMQGSSSDIAPDDFFTADEYNAWIRSLPPGALGGDTPPTSDDFKAWRILRRRNAVPEPPSDMARRVARDRRLRRDRRDEAEARTLRDQDASERPDDEAMFKDSHPATANEPISPPLVVVENTSMRSSSDPRFLFAITASLVQTRIAPVGHVGIVFEVDVVLKDRVRVTLQADVRGASHPILIEIPFGELWRCVMLEMELPFNVIPLVGENIVSWLPRLPAPRTAALMHLRRHLVELWLDGKASDLILRGSPPVVHHYVGRLNMMRGEAPSDGTGRHKGRRSFADSRAPAEAPTDEAGRKATVETPLTSPPAKSKHRPLTGPPPAATPTNGTARADVSSTPLPKYIPPPSGMPKEGTPEFETECAKMRVVEEAQRAALLSSKMEEKSFESVRVRFESVGGKERVEPYREGYKSSQTRRRFQPRTSLLHLLP